MQPDADDPLQDPDYCLRQQAEYLAKARATANQKLRAAYEAAAQELALRASRLRASSPAAVAG